MDKIDKEKCLGKLEWILSEINDTEENLTKEELEMREILWDAYDKINNLHKPPPQKTFIKRE